MQEDQQSTGSAFCPPLSYVEIVVFGGVQTSRPEQVWRRGFQPPTWGKMFPAELVGWRNFKLLAGRKSCTYSCHQLSQTKTEL